MPNSRLVALQNRLENTFDRASRLDYQETELRSDYAKYLCVLVSGFMEYVLYELALDHCRKKSSPRIVNYVSKNLEKIQNPKFEKILDLLSSFDPAWGTEFEDFATGQKKEALNSVVALRNQIAHGENANITLASIITYYKQIKLIIKFLSEKFEA